MVNFLNYLLFQEAHCTKHTEFICYVLKFNPSQTNWPKALLIDWLIDYVHRTGLILKPLNFFEGVIKIVKRKTQTIILPHMGRKASTVQYAGGRLLQYIRDKFRGQDRWRPVPTCFGKQHRHTGNRSDSNFPVQWMSPKRKEFQSGHVFGLDGGSDRRLPISSGECCIIAKEQRTSSAP